MYVCFFCFSTLKSLTFCWVTRSLVALVRGLPQVSFKLVVQSSLVGNIGAPDLADEGALAGNVVIRRAVWVATTFFFSFKGQGQLGASHRSGRTLPSNTDVRI